MSGEVALAEAADQIVPEREPGLADPEDPWPVEQAKVMPALEACVIGFPCGSRDCDVSTVRYFNHRTRQGVRRR
ncbi:hypothetical protein Vqi01_39090 [Micromonospora qiuiae]|uniref:Uncharacterized protein n=1 Tax=Micromonospora qiuiae TaxID=502268 RepID=A0ABQ4JH03_9ACTN|nr:hypothetical protein Vqi01_39090 [Micromonospora qiuiae]